MRFGRALVLSLAGGAIALPAPAAEQEKKPPPASTELRREARPVPDYDGRPDEPETGHGAGVWTGRVILFPLYVVSEFVLRRPLGWLVVTAERENVAQALIDFFTFGPDRKIGVIPTFLFDFGFRPSGGAYVFWDDMVAPGHDLRVYAATGGIDWLRLSIANRFELATRTRLTNRLEIWKRPDWLFYGMGPESRDVHRSRYGFLRSEASFRLDIEPFRGGRLGGFVAARRTAFDAGGCCDDPSIERVIQTGAYAAPPGYAQGYSLYRQGLELVLDSRRPRPHPGSGLRLVARGEQNARLAGAGPDQWLRWGGALGGFVDLNDGNRVLGLSVAASFADPISDDDEIPFTEQVTLGGIEPLRGFLDGRLVDRSALVTRLEYQWPIWTFLDGTLAGEAGNVFGEHLAGFDAELARLSATLGIRTQGQRDHPFEVLFGIGTTPLADGARIESFRFVFGTSNGF